MVVVLHYFQHNFHFHLLHSRVPLRADHFFVFVDLVLDRMTGAFIPDKGHLADYAIKYRVYSVHPLHVLTTVLFTPAGPQAAQYIVAPEA